MKSRRREKPIFPERIYVYRHRIWEKHKVDVASLVILCDNEQNYRPNKYKKGIWGCELNFTFPIVKLLDFAENWTKLENDGNPFAIVVMAQLKARNKGWPTTEILEIPFDQDVV